MHMQDAGAADPGSPVASTHSCGSNNLDCEQPGPVGAVQATAGSRAASDAGSEPHECGAAGSVQEAATGITAPQLVSVPSSSSGGSYSDDDWDGMDVQLPDEGGRPAPPEGAGNAAQAPGPAGADSVQQPAPAAAQGVAAALVDSSDDGSVF